jgi:hypothetical protein
MEKIVRGSGGEPPDSFVVSTVGGFKRRKLEVNDWIVLAPREDARFVAGGTKVHFGWIGGRR